MLPALAAGALLLMAAWACAALWFQAPGGAAGRAALLALWVALSVAALAGLWRGERLAAGLGFAVAFSLVLAWWHRLRPSNDHLWADDLARTACGEIRDAVATLHNVRNFEWRSPTDYTPRWETRSYDLRQLESLDLITSYWAGPAIAHVIVSFGFSDARHLAFSVEIRRRSGQKFSELGGFFKAFELSIIAADERDVVRVRTNIRGEDDYLYRVRLPLAHMRSLFAAYLEQMNELVHTPRFYNTISVNCTTLVYHMMQHISGRLPLSYRLLLSGYLPGYVYAVGGLDSRYPLRRLRELGHITARARAAGDSAQFSALIRRGIPPLPRPPETP